MKTLARYEKQVLSAFETGKLKSTVTSEAALRRYREYARTTLSKSQRVNIRLSTPDLSEIQTRAAEEGVPYQNLIASVLHKWGRPLYRKIIASCDAREWTGQEASRRVMQ